MAPRSSRIPAPRLEGGPAPIAASASPGSRGCRSGVTSPWPVSCARCFPHWRSIPAPPCRPLSAINGAILVLSPPWLYCDAGTLTDRNIHRSMALPMLDV